MKAISDRKMDMSRGEPDSDGYFPEMAHHKKLGRPGEIKMGQKYPDTEEAVLRDQDQFVSSTGKDLPKPGYRH